MDTTAEQHSITGEIPAQSTSAENEQLVFTIAPGGEIVSVEKLEKTGSRTTLSTDECAVLAGEDADEVESALIAGYEAGILEGAGDDDLLERMMLIKIITHQSGETVRALRRTMLRRFLLRRLVRRAAQNAKGELKG